MNYDLEEIEEIISEGRAMAECPVCGYEDVIEPDGDGICPECGKGRFASPLVLLGMI